MLRPGYSSIGHFANNCPDTLSSSRNSNLVPMATKRIRPVQSGSSNFQSAALQNHILLKETTSLATSSH